MINVDKFVGDQLSVWPEVSARFRALRSAAVRRLEVGGLEVVLQDERLTTYEADSIIKETGNHRKNRKDHIDSMAAAIILTDYLDQDRTR